MGKKSVLICVNPCPKRRESDMNPYLNQVMIRNPNDFYRCKLRVIRLLYARINAFRPQDELETIRRK